MPSAPGARQSTSTWTTAEALAAEQQPDPAAPGDFQRQTARLDPHAAIARSVGLEGEDAATTARRLSMPEGAVGVAPHRAMRRLAELVQGAPR